MKLFVISTSGKARHSYANTSMASLTAVGLFSGCGGFDLGASLAGFDLKGAFDNDPIAIETYRRNVSPHAEVLDLSVEEVSHSSNSVDLILGGPPCQGFSSAGPKKASDERNGLWLSYVRTLSLIRPKAFILENVYGFLKEYEAFSTTLQDVLKDEYIFEYRKINTQFYGIPQQRLRLFVVGILRDVSKAVPWPKPLVPEVSNQQRGGGWRVVDGMNSMESALGDFGPARAASSPRERTWGNCHEYLPLESSHAAVAPHVPNGGSLRSVPDSHLPATYQGRTRTRKGWAWYYRKPNPLLPGRTVTAATGPCYSQVLAPDVIPVKENGSWNWEIIDPSKYTSSKGLYTSPVPQRRLTVKECARLQTFPDEFEFFGTLAEKHRQIGNAVPVEYSRQLCSAIADALNGKTCQS
jgi:DNA (cytosine-5)-methyltransferase 1